MCSRFGVICGIVISFISLFFLSLKSLLSSPQGYGEEGIYSEQEGIASGPLFGSGIGGK